jgi:hypothetical protein
VSIAPDMPRLDRFDHDQPAKAKLSTAEKVGLFALCVMTLCVVFGLALRFDHRERDRWRADWMRRTELCETQGGIPRYQERGASYDGCDFPPQRQQ